MSVPGRPVRLVLVLITAASLLAGCGGSSPAPVVAAPSSSAASASAAGTSGTGSGTAGSSSTGSGGTGSSRGSGPSGSSGGTVTRTGGVGMTATGSTAAGAAMGTKPVLILEPDGLGVLVGAASIRQLPFGQSDLTTLKTVLAATLGAVRTSQNAECGQGPRTSLDHNGFTALFDGQKFVGWSDGSTGTPRLSTGNGIGVGTTLAALRKAYGKVTVTTASLGPEFSTDGGLNGLLDGTKDSSKATLLYAGESCFFR